MLSTDTAQDRMSDSSQISDSESDYDPSIERPIIWGVYKLFTGTIEDEVSKISVNVDFHSSLIERYQKRQGEPMYENVKRFFSGLPFLKGGVHKYSVERREPITPGEIRYRPKPVDDDQWVLPPKVVKETYYSYSCYLPAGKGEIMEEQMNVLKQQLEEAIGQQWEVWISRSSPSLRKLAREALEDRNVRTEAILSFVTNHGVERAREVLGAFQL
ncbi:hypothetical protein DFS34DRAFT_238664 [Phlyctochytrium arcticum]|nr:hypothetical protein DFS34DRAFT_238664 [Phlyctochytrium arcticum]